MKAPLEWLKEYIKLEGKPEKFADALTMSGIEVSAIEYHGRNISDVVVGKIKSIEKHATKEDVFICQVDTGIKMLQIVTKAQNLKVGDKVPVALHGATLPSGMKIVKRDMHGVESFGMLCSKAELGLEEGSEGIMVLDKDTAIGEDIRKVLGIGGAVLELDVLPNRIDVLSIIGVARELGAVLNKKMKSPCVKVKESGGSAGSSAKITVKDKELCPRYMARVIKNVKIGQSPQWMQDRLISCGMRPINNVVDITNYVLLELGQPLHAFDLKLIKGAEIIVRKAKKGEKISTLDGEKRTLDVSTLVIADAERAVAIAGIMGGMDSEVSDITKDILLESAYFEPKSIHRTEKTLKLRTEASTRFDRGVDWDMVPVALDRAAQLLGELAGGNVQKGKLDVLSKRRTPKKIKLRTQRVNQMLGTDITVKDIRSVLERLGFTFKNDEVSIPLFRAGDIEREIDIIEEIARIYGYNKIPARMPDLKIEGMRSRSDKQLIRIKQMMIDAGLNEVITYSMLPPGSTEIGKEYGSEIRLMNPITEDLAIMRRSLLPSLLNVVTYNLNHQNDNVNIFEVGKVFFKDEKGHYCEKLSLGAVFIGERTFIFEGKKEKTDFYQIKKLVKDILDYLGCAFTLKTNELPGFHPGRSACAYSGDELIAVFGDAHPDITAKLGSKNTPVILHLFLDKVLDLKRLPPRFKDIPVYPSVRRDIAMLVPYGVTHEAIIKEITATGAPLIENVELFDKYEGDKLEKGYYSLAYSIIYRDAARTLRDDEVNQKHEQISNELAKKLAVKIRK